jgi:hypothetical protein
MPKLLAAEKKERENSFSNATTGCTQKRSAPMGTKISKEFGCREGTLREKLVDALGRRKGKQVASGELIKMVYGSAAKDASHSSLMMIVKGAGMMIAKNKLSYRLRKERNAAGEITLGLYSATKRTRRARAARKPTA